MNNSSFIIMASVGISIMVSVKVRVWIRVRDRGLLLKFECYNIPTIFVF